MRLVGYSDRLSAAPGEQIQFMVSCANPDFHVEIVRLIHGDTNPLGPGFKEEVIPSSLAGDYPGRVQTIKTGSYVSIPASTWLDLAGSFTLSTWIWATTPGQGIQGLISRWDEHNERGYALVLDEQGSVELWLGGAAGSTRASSGAPLNPMTWYQITATFDAVKQRITIVQRPEPAWPFDASHKTVATEVDQRDVVNTTGPLLFGALGVDGASFSHFNGKVDSPRILGRALTQAEVDDALTNPIEIGNDPALVGRWDFSQEIASARVIDIGPHQLHGTAINLPTRAVTGHNWSGDEVNHRHAPGEYGAIHFHEDDLDDAGWEVDFSWTVPVGLRSGVYAARLTSNGDEDYLPVVVRPARGTATAKIAYLISTFTYLAYANEHVPVEPVELYPFLDVNAHLDEYRYIDENSLHSLYDVHRDGSGVCYASWKRPMVNTRPKATFRIYSSPERLGTDLYLVDWLETLGFRYDTIADENIHDDGVELLKQYKVVVTGCHPEYGLHR